MENKIAEIRKLKKIKQIDVANAVGVAKSTYIGYETSYHKPTPEVLCKIADFLNVSIDELLGRVPEQQIFDDARVPKTEVQEIFDSLNPVQQELSLAYMKGLVEYNRKEELKKNQQTHNKRLA